MKKVLSLVLFSFVLCSGFLCPGSTVHNLRVANADLASALNHGAQEIIFLNMQGAITQEEENLALGQISASTILSDGVTKCLDASAASAPVLSACVKPLLAGVQTNMQALGIKSANAQATVTAIVGAVNGAITEFAAQGVTQ
jgi:hypothetical protein